MKRWIAALCVLALTLTLTPAASAAYGEHYACGDILGGAPGCRHDFDNLWAHAETEKASCTEVTYSYWLCRLCGAKYVCGVHYPQGHAYINGVCRCCGAAESSGAGTEPEAGTNPGNTAEPGTGANPGSTGNPGTSQTCDHSALYVPWTYAQVEATCTSEGRAYRICQRCGYEQTLSTQGKKEHSWKTTTVPATTSAEGRIYRTCTVCGKEETVSTLPALPAPPAITPPTADSASSARSAEEQAAYEAMLALKSQYPTGTRWTNDNYYAWKGGIYSGGYGCAGFAFLLSDAAFGDLPARKLAPVSFANVRVGDILRDGGDTHSVIVLEVREDSVVVAEGNMNSAVYWGRTLSKASVNASSYLMTRWPLEGAASKTPAETEKPAAPAEVPQPSETVNPGSSDTPFTDVSQDAYYYDGVQWALQNNVTNGVTATQFQPGAACTRGQVVTFLWRAKGCPEPRTTVNPFQDVSPSSPFYKAILWAQENGITAGVTATSFNPGGTCTSGHVVTFLWRAEGRPGASGSSALAGAYPGQYYTDAVAWADSSGLLRGVGGEFVPTRQSPRADIVTYLYRNLAA